MTTIRTFFGIFLIGLTALWGWTDTTAWASLSSLSAWRWPLLQWTGVMAMGVMALALVLAVRPVVFEGFFGGLDKMYRLHKWLGISALAWSVTHWLAEDLPKQRRPRPAPPEEWWWAFLQGQRHFAEEIGEQAFNAVVVLIVLALVKWFPYRWFFKTHRLLAVAYLALVWHTVVLLDRAQWSTPLGWTLGVLLAAGSLSAVVVLLRRVGRQRQVLGTVSERVVHDKLQVIELGMKLQGEWPGHAAGQFAFVTLDPAEGPHPYTIAWDWRGDGNIRFIVKALGDYTRTLAKNVQPGDPVRIEGPYGRFTFKGRQSRQIWIGAGIGITPFIARMQQLARQPDGKRIDLFHPTADLDPEALALLQRDADAAGVTLHVLWTPRDGRLDAQRLAAQVPDWREADVWFCGPAEFGQTLRRDLVARGLPGRRFHQELFAMR